MSCKPMSNEKIDKNFVLDKYSDLFEGLGAFQKPYKIIMKENAKPVAHSAHSVPHAIMDKLKAKLVELEKIK